MSIIKESITNALEGIVSDVKCCYDGPQCVHATLVADADGNVICSECFSPIHDATNSDKENEELKEEFLQYHEINGNINEQKENEEDYEVCIDTSGKRIHPGDFISFKMYPKGTNRGTVEISKRTTSIDNKTGKVSKTLVVRDEDGTLFDMPGPSATRKILQSVNESKKEDERDKEDKFNVLKHIRMPSPQQKGGSHRDKTKYDRKRDNKRAKFDELREVIRSCVLSENASSQSLFLKSVKAKCRSYLGSKYNSYWKKLADEYHNGDLLFTKENYQNVVQEIDNAGAGGFAMFGGNQDKIVTFYLPDSETLFIFDDIKEEFDKWLSLTAKKYNLSFLSNNNDHYLFEEAKPDYAKNVPSIVYHTTVASKVSEIRKNGLNPSSGEKSRTYGSGKRLYVWADKGSAIGFGTTSYNLSQEDRFAVITISINEHIPFYYDRELGKSALWTHNNIPASAIKRIDFYYWNKNKQKLNHTKTISEAREWVRDGFDMPIDCMNASTDPRDPLYGSFDEDEVNIAYLVKKNGRFRCSRCRLDSEDPCFMSIHRLGGLVKNLNEVQGALLKREPVLVSCSYGDDIGAGEIVPLKLENGRVYCSKCNTKLSDTHRQELASGMLKTRFFKYHSFTGGEKKTLKENKK